MTASGYVDRTGGGERRDRRRAARDRVAGRGPEALSVLLLIGVWFGARIAHRASSTTLKRIVSLTLVGVGLMMLARLALQATGALSGA